MSDNKGPDDPNKKTDAKDDELSEQELANLAGALPGTIFGGGGGGIGGGNKVYNDDCKATSDTGIGGCPG